MIFEVTENNSSFFLRLWPLFLGFVHEGKLWDKIQPIRRSWLKIREINFYLKFVSHYLALL